MKFGKILPFLRRDNTGTDILLTGVPRSGTTLACRLLCDFSQTIALNEPMDKNQFENPKSAFKNIKEHFNDYRKSLRQNGTATARTQDGKLTDNAFNPDSSKRERVVIRSKIVFDKPLDRNFTLIMKHCAEFTLLLPELAKTFTVFALVRNPLAILASWASVDVPVSRGKVAKSAQLNPSFHAALINQGGDLLKRQLFILSWYFGQYNDFAKSNIIRYEEMIASPEKILSNLANGKPEKPFASLQNKNASLIYNKPQVERMGEALLNSEGYYWQYYSKDDVAQLLQKIMSNE